MATNFSTDGLGYGGFANALFAGQVFTYVTPSQAILLSATTGTSPTLFNPAGSGKLFIPVALRLNFVSGTTTIGSVVIADTLNAGANIATGAAILTGTAVAGKPGIRGSGFASVMQWLPTTNTFTAAPAVTYSTGINLGTAAPSVPGPYECLFSGTLAYYPGSAMSICYTVTTSTSLWWTTLVGLEVPLPF